MEGRCKATWERGFKLPWREAGPPNRHDDKVVSDQSVDNEDLSLSAYTGIRGSVFSKLAGRSGNSTQACRVETVS